MSSGAERDPRFRLTFHLGIGYDLRALGERRVSADLSGLARVKFDAPGRRPQRFRVIYRQADETTRDVLAIGARDEHAAYRAAAARLVQAVRQRPPGDAP